MTPQAVRRRWRAPEAIDRAARERQLGVEISLRGKGDRAKGDRAKETERRETERRRQSEGRRRDRDR